ncbi:hypothetical protein E0H86_05670 [Acinetobacter sp. ANC 4635]|uniref:hypothetical protein n=1 Tax=Acinetobacter sp. ANC 4635 TaxID=2529846 RepID=UPI00103FB921|nr:hypothetical protein [Acinetobacter sp. ANC 4635]TCB31908.1 hypothetical protein E0H86_05670 [Acinetobacter sp. ANC 4635]
MNRLLNIKLENCFGIGRLEKEFKFTSKERAQLIYAPNGTMKSSFATVFDYLSKDKISEIKDRVFSENISTCEINFDGGKINKDMILVVNAETKISEKSITKFIAKTELKNRYDEIFAELLNEKSKFIAVLKRQSRSSDCEGELEAVFNEGETFFEYLLRIESDLYKNHPKYNFRYNDIFDKGDKVKKFLETNQSLLDEYLNRYIDLLRKSKFFSKSNNSFGTLQATNLLDSLNDNSFFDAGHKISLQTQEFIASRDELEALIQGEKDQILNDVQLLKSFDKVDKALSKNAELKNFKNLIESEPHLLVELADFESFRKKIWLSHISEMKSEVAQVLDIYKTRKSELQQIMSNANDEVNKWKETIELFNSRFYVPFTIKLENQSDVILKSDIPKLKFIYKDRDIPDNNENILLDVLSRGESRAYYILRFLFEIESRLDANQNILLIFDDVADSFDYKNKYAIIEYIKDLLERPNVNAIILTHNFDFYRTVSKRLNIRSSSFMATKSNDGFVKITKGKYFEDVFQNIFINNYHKEKNFVGIIPFVRNLFEYLSNDQGFNFLTSCLHVKPNTRDITIKNVHDCLVSVIQAKSDLVLDFKDKLLLDVIFDQAEIVVGSCTEHSIDLEDKLIIAMACRLKAEIFMISKLSSDVVNSISKNQTQELYKLCKEENLDTETLRLLNKVNLVTPEHIHLNSFMFEPLVDMSMNNLVTLYLDLCTLDSAVT